MLTVEEKILKANKEYHSYSTIKKMSYYPHETICRYCSKVLYINKELIDNYSYVLHKDCYKKFLLFPVLENEI